MLLAAEWVLPVTSEPIRNGAVAVQGDSIKAVGPRDKLLAAFPSEKTVDFGESILMPGLVNAHSHLDYTIMRGLLDRYPFFPWISTLTKLRKGLSDEDMLASARWGAVEAIRSGITALGDAGETGASCRAMSEAGLRGVFYQEVFGFRHDEIAPAMKKLEGRLEALQSVKNNLVRLGISPHAPFTVSPGLFRTIGDYAARHDYPLCIHIAESPEEDLLMSAGTGVFADFINQWGAEWTPPGVSAVGYLDGIGILDRRPLLAHCVHVSEADIAILLQSGAAIAHCPKSNAKFGHGLAPLPAFLSAGLTVGLGSDGVASNNTLDLFDEMRVGLLLQRASQAGFPILTARQMVELATTGGAAALGITSTTGSLEAGKSADLIAVSLGKAHNSPTYDPYSALVYTANQDDVQFTMVAGRVLYEKGRVTSLDEEKLRTVVSNLARKLETAGIGG
ncbi:MAG: amidohydrolase family protein [Chloroflexi bacterium]|nr:amidohydrolase family protein [Chloroflexota bacterium]